ncbi:sigma-54-dependent transcriptional regulator [bacterium]
MAKILLVDDEEKILKGLSKALGGVGHDVGTSTSGPDALSMLDSSVYDIVFSDLVMPDMDGLELLSGIKKKYPDMPVIIVTGHGTVESAVLAMKNGAFDYITKPFNLDEVDLVVSRALEHRRLLEENVALKNQIKKKYNFDNIIGESDAFQEVYRIMDKVKDTPSTVLIMGQSGTGKELVARAIHYNGYLHEKQFLTVDCASLTESLLESELFGHVKGSFTGAHKDKEGYFEAADEGTIFLDEIGEFSPGLQSRLLRVLQEGEFTRVGDSKPRKVDVRVIAATNRDLEQMVSDGHFREDLFYRLNVITIHVPPLEDRLEDLPLFVNHFIEQFNVRLSKNTSSVSDEVLTLFANYSWPGNVRELENVMERIMTFCDEPTIVIDHVPEPLKKKIERQKVEDMERLISRTYKDAKTQVMIQFNRDYLQTLIEKCDGNISKASRISGMDRGCFYRLMKKYNLQNKDDD